jgi:lysine N6-hydroxylase
MSDIFDLVGVGVGPANLSLAALADACPGLRAHFLETKPDFQWHRGMMLPSATIQVSYLKDLVTLVDPTSRYSFLNYLASHGRLYRFLVAGRETCSRREFELYYRWVADQLRTISWDCRVDQVKLERNLLTVTSNDGRRWASLALVVGSGRIPVLPKAVEKLRGPTVLHSSEFCSANPDVADRDVLVVGAGQSSAEIVLHLISDESRLPRSVTWMSKRLNFLPLDDSPFTNEWFTPAYVEYFHGLTAERRQELLHQQRLASDGVSAALLQRIYRRLYDLDTTEPGRLRHRLLPSRRVIGLSHDLDRLVATVHCQDSNSMERHVADIVICCTGYQSVFPKFLEPLRARVAFDGRGDLVVREDYSLVWDGPASLAIFVQNAAKHTHGIADPNLSLVAWRSARIINAICRRRVYDIHHSTPMINWRLHHTSDPPMSTEKKVNIHAEAFA